MAESTQNGKGSAEIAPVGDWTFTPEQRAAIRAVYAPKATDAQFEIFMMEASRRKLMPGKQLFFRLQASNEWDAELRQKVRTEKPIHITGIDAFRLIAQRTKLYAGQKPIVWIYLKNSSQPATLENLVRTTVPLEKVKPYAAEVAVLRKDFQEPLVAIARWSAYVQTYKEKDSGAQVPNSMWAKMGPEQLAKCAEALALRKAFPEDLWGLYIAEEFPDNPDDSPQSTAANGVAAVPPAAALPPAPVSVAPAVEVVEKKSASPEPAGATVSPEPVAPNPAAADPMLKKMEETFGGKVEVKGSTENEKPAGPDPAAGRPAGKEGGIWYVRNVLDPAGVKQGGELLRQYMVRATGVADAKKIKAAQWNTVLAVLDGTLRKGDKDAVVKLITETVQKAA